MYRFHSVLFLSSLSKYLRHKWSTLQKKKNAHAHFIISIHNFILCLGFHQFFTNTTCNATVVIYAGATLTQMFKNVGTCAGMFKQKSKKWFCPDWL